MITLSQTEVNGMLKRVYNDLDNEIFPVLTVLFAQIEKATSKMHNINWGGDGAYFPITAGQPTGAVASDSGYLPEDAKALEVQGKEVARRIYVRRDIDNFVVTATKDPRAAFKPILRKVAREVVSALRLLMQEVLHADGNAIKALVTTGHASTPVVQHPMGITGAGRGGLALAPGMYVQFQPSGGGAARVVMGGPGNNTVKIATITHAGDAATLTFADGATVAGMLATDEVIAATLYDNSRGFNPNGMTKILNRGGSYATLHNQTPATAGLERWNSTRMAAGTDTATLSPIESDIWELIARVYGRSGFNAFETPDEFILVGTPGMEKALAESLIGQRTFPTTDRLKGGFKALEICGLPFIKDSWCPAGTIYLIHLPSLFRIDAAEFGLITIGSDAGTRFVANRDAQQLPYRWYGNFGTNNRAAHGMITGYTDTNRYDHTIA